MADNLSALLKRASLDDHDELLKAANNTLKQSKNNLEAQHVRLVALIKLDRYDDALRVLNEAGEPLKSQAPLEQAYTLYRTGNIVAAQNVLKSTDGGRGSALLDAQLAYRSEDFGRAAGIYRSVLEQGLADAREETDLRINGGAVDAQLAWSGLAPAGAKPKIGSADLERFDMAFNAACGCIARGEIKQAEFLLGRAKALCEADEELSDAEKSDEILPIQAQLLYVLQALGKSSEAKALSAQLRAQDIADSATKRIATVNKLLASGSLSNPYLAQRQFSSASKATITEKPFAFQDSLLASNELVLDLSIKKYGAISSAVRAQKSQAAPLDKAWVGVFDAAAHARDRTGKEAIKEILPILEQRQHDIGLVLTVVQLYVLTNNVQTATTLLETFLQRLEARESGDGQDTRFAPGLVATIAALYSVQNRTALAKAELAKAAKHWRHRRKGDAGTNSLLQAAGSALVGSSSSEDEIAFAHELFTAVAETSPSDPVAKAGLAASQPSGAEIDTNSLPSIAELTNGIDVDELEAQGITRPVSKVTPPVAAKRPADSPAKASKAKKIRKSRLPKDFDAAKKPDPERWLPLRDRSSWRPKGKKKNRSQGGGGTQGGIEEGSKGPSQPVQQQPSSSQGGGKNKKKKGKGK